MPRTQSPSADPARPRKPHPRRLIAAIDIGATAIRMMLAQVCPDGSWTPVETLSQGILLGRDVFTNGDRIAPAAMDAATATLRQYAAHLSEYGIAPADIHAIATSAVREAGNRDAFVDRLAIATGMHVAVAGESDINRMLYLAFAPTLRAHPELRRGTLVLAEVGGGVTEFLGMQDAKVRFSRTARIGAMRLLDLAREHRIPKASLAEFLKSQVDTSLKQFKVPDGALRSKLVLMGSEARLAATTLLPGWEDAGLARIPTKAFVEFAKDVLAATPADLAETYRMPLADAETLGTSLLIQARIARWAGVPEVRVGSACLRDGIVAEAVGGAALSSDFTAQVLASASELGEKFQWDRRHAATVARYAVDLFDALAPEHALGPRERLQLQVAALLHDVGTFISPKAHHKHSMYIIQNSNLFGLGEADITTIAIVARYHRKATPQRSHEEYARLPASTRSVVAKLAAILRVADALDRSHECRLGPSLGILRRKGRLDIVPGNASGDASAEEVALREKGAFLAEIYGLSPTLSPRT